MPVTLNTQQAAQAARRRLTSCYLCGKPLPPRGPGWRKGTSADHVIPRAMLDLVVPRPVDPWPLILDVHPDCDAKYKAPRDQLAKIVGVIPAREWTEEEAGLFRNRLGLSHEDVGALAPVPMVHNADEILYVAYLWARGFHAALYGEVLPWSQIQWTAAPSPAYSPDSADTHADIREGMELSRYTLSLLGDVIGRGEADSVSLLGGAVEYDCAWARMPDEFESPWACLWALSGIPGADKWSRETRGQETPWHGVYRVQEKPALAAETVNQDM